MRVLVHDTVTGRFVTELQYVDYSYSTAVRTEDSVTVQVPGYTAESRGLAGVLTPRKMSISVSDEDRKVMAAGVLGVPEFASDDDDMNKIAVPSRGIESLYEKRFVLPYPYGRLVDANNRPVSQYNTTFRNVDYGTMIKKLYEQAMSHPNGGVRHTFEPDRPGSREKAWSAIEGKPVQDAVEDISDLLGGVEWDWVPTLDEEDNLTWNLVTGRDDQPEIISEYLHTWQLGGRRPDLKGWKGKTSPEFMTSSTFFTGGKDEDEVMVAQHHDPTLLNAGFPLTEEWDSSHSSVSVQATLEDWSESRLAQGQAPIQYWSFDLRRSSARGLRHGDLCEIEARNHWALPDGTYTRRVMEVSGSSKSEWLSIVVAGEMEW